MKKDNNLITFIKGFVIGLGIIFPVSASVLAIVMGIYEKILKIINSFFKLFKKNLSFIIWMVLGIIASVIVSCLLLDYTLNAFPIATLLFFIGLIVGGIPLLLKKTKKDYQISNFLYMLIGIIIIVGISFVSTSKIVSITPNAISLIKLFFVGVLGAGSMIVPGVSGSVMLVILGYYAPLLAVISNTVKFISLGSNILIIFVFGIGMLIGIILFSKIMDYLLTKFEVKTYFAIIGFVIASVINVTLSLFGYAFNIWEVTIGIALFVLGFICSFKYLKEE